MEEETISSNTCGYIKIDKLFIKDVEKLYEEYLKVKEILKKEKLVLDYYLLLFYNYSSKRYDKVNYYRQLLDCLLHHSSFSLYHIIVYLKSSANVFSVPGRFNCSPNCIIIDL